MAAAPAAASILDGRGSPPFIQSISNDNDAAGFTIFSDRYIQAGNVEAHFSVLVPECHQEQGFSWRNPTQPVVLVSVWISYMATSKRRVILGS
jgi:hypothetical protein